MDDIKDKMTNIKDKIVGQTKETIGDIFDNEEMKLKGRIQYSKADIKENIDNKLDDIKETVEDTFDDVKENIAGKINDFLDKKNNKKED